MAAIDFPASPAVNDVFVAGNGVSYKWNGTMWLPLSSAAGGASITVSDTPPGSPTAGAMWWNSVLGTLMIYYQDPNTSQWVPAAPSASVSQLKPKVTKFAANGTFTPDPNLVHGYVVGIGGGGAAGAFTGSAGFAQGAGGGASGCTVTTYFVAAQVLPTVAVTIGAGGIAVTGGLGGTGGATIFGTLLMAVGGAGGGQYSGGAPSASGCIGDVIAPNFPGGMGMQIQGTATGIGGNGGGPGGGLGAVVGSSASAGAVGTANSGGGGGGTASSNAGGTWVAVNGGSGFLYVVEYVRA